MNIILNVYWLCNNAIANHSLFTLTWFIYLAGDRFDSFILDYVLLRYIETLGSDSMYIDTKQSIDQHNAYYDPAATLHQTRWAIDYTKANATCSRMHIHLYIIYNTHICMYIIYEYVNAFYQIFAIVNNRIYSAI